MSYPPALLGTTRSFPSSRFEYVSSADESTLSWSLQPQTDGTLRGVQTITVLSNECGSQGNVYKSPLVATRTGDAPPNIIVADPALFLS